MVSAPNNNTNGYTDIGIAKWSTEHVHAWLNDAGFGHIAEHIAFDQEIDGKVLLLLNESDLREPPLSLQRLGDIKKLAYAIRQLQSTIAVNPLDASLCGLSVSTSAIDPPTVPNGLHNVHQISQLSSSSKSDSGTRLFQMITREEWIKRVEAPDTKAKSMLKLGLAFCYCLASLLITAFVMVLVHDRVPDMKTYPPLPDLVLDNLPLIPWAFECCEMIAVAMAMIWFTVLFFHKERVVILRRMFSLVGTVFLLRCVTMLITSLSVPGVHLACRAKSYGDIRAKLVQAFNIWSKLGMSIQGVRTCGDYMFSGHTTVITLLNHFITEYTPHSWHALHTATWIMNFFGVFFILAGHEHYSIDVFIAFYISSRMFLYYHTYAYNHINLTTNDSRMRLWFPLGWFFEAGGVGRVTNEFDLPFPTHFGATENDDAKPDETELTMKSKFCAATDNGMFRENQARKSVSLIDLRCGDSPMFIDTAVASTDDKSVLKSDPMAPIYRADSMTSFAPMPMSNMMVVCRQPSNGWFSEDDSGVESASVVSTNEPSVALRQLFALHRNRRPRMAAFVGDRERVSKLVRGKVQKRAPLFTLGGSRRKSIQNDFRLPPLMANPRGNGAKTTRVVRRGTCRCHGKSVIGTMEDCDDLLSVPSSSSSSSESPSCIFSSQPRCNVAFSSTTRRRHSLYAKVYGHRISAVVEENPRSIVEGLDLDRSASYVEPCNSHPPLMPTSSLSVDFFTSDVDNTLNRFNSLCIEMQSDDQPFSDALMPTEDLCTQFSMMTTQPHSTGHSPFASPAPTDSWTMSTGPSASAHDLLTPNASDLRASLTFFFPKPSDSSFTG